MPKISLKDWVILLTILPTTLISFGLAGYFSYSRSIELSDHLEQQAKSIIEPIAIASKNALLNKNREELRELISITHRSQSSIINSIVIFGEDNQMIVTSNYHGDANLMRLPQKHPALLSTEIEHISDYIIFRSPILDEKQNHNDSISKRKSVTSSQKNLGYIALQVDKGKINFTQQSQYIIAFTFALFASLLSAIFAMRLIQKVTKPLSSMVVAIDKIREGKLESRVSGQLIGELNFLKGGINAIAQSLDNYQMEMQTSIDQATIDLRDSLEQFEIQNVELSMANKKAQEASKVKSEFLANMSHELRTPLNGVIGFTRQVLKTPLSDNQREYLQIIERSANNLLRIINDILDFSKLDAGKMVIENIPFSLRESLEETLTLIAPSAHKKNIELSVNIANTLPDSLVGDIMRIKQIVTNLIANAIKFTQEGSVTIEIGPEQITDEQRETLGDKAIRLKITVTDTGIGMTEQQQRTIFDAFTQADQSITRLYGGTGLGLVISQRLAQEMQGDIAFNSEKKVGSSFWFTFQCEINPIPLVIELDNHHLTNKSVLYYEENQHSHIATSKILQQWHMNIVSASNPHQLAQILSHNEQAQKGFDYALIGHSHTATALSALKKTIAQVQPRADKIYLALNSNSPSLQEALIASGAVNCISKPLTPINLSRALQPKTKNEQLSITKSKRKILPIKVLAVDDNEANLKLIQALLLEQVSEVVLAENGKQAVELCQKEAFSLIFMDIQMPIMDGISALKAIKNTVHNDSTAIIAVTAHALSGEREKMHQQGFNAYMTKPIDETMLSHIIYEYCDIEHFINEEANIQAKKVSVQETYNNGIVNWDLALKRSANKEVLAQEMFSSLINSLLETQASIINAVQEDNIDELKRLIHKLNGACCYTGTPNLANIVSQLETQLKLGISVNELEPEFLEFFEHIEQLINYAPSILAKN
ncbi:two-component sensor histidine kinase BarA [Colwellia sp. D2M02]|uniref:two-component sensor histidine kinase BarA n=1 Tax=Colwellia sp. D2M02 TaxID=2841562 RepID=UPI001C096DC6|nr:two-component sensor histidine kinase BarA [Colwellia sp. D2M02]MBU2894448.1 two-component sensor histidine kinase BarA [Colwellia sp. D2M02]